MGAINIRKLHQATVFIDGVGRFGEAEEITLPDIMPKMTEHKSLGMKGTLEYTAGIDKLTAKIKWNSFYGDAFGYSADFYTGRNIQVRGVSEVYDATGGRVKVEAFRCEMAGMFKKLPGLSFKQQDNADGETEITCSMYAIYLDSVEIVYLNIATQEYRVNGVDLWAQERAILGI